MALHFTTAEEALCAFLDESTPDPEHTAQLHIPLSSLPSPDTPISIPSFPIEIHSETSVFKPRNIANLWTQLLSIQIQNGSLWKHENAVALHKEKAPVPVPSRDELEVAEHKRIEKTVLFLRHKIQKGLLRTDRPPIEAELPEISRYFALLESLEDIDLRILRVTKIQKVCKYILRSDNIPGDDAYQFKARSALLFERFNKILEQSAQQNATESEAPTADIQLAEQTEQESQKISGSEELKEPPDICLSHLTPEQCAHIKEAARACNPPLDRSVVELMCMLPHLTSKIGVSDLRVFPLGRLVQPFDNGHELDRSVYSGGPTLPPHMLQLTSWESLNYGTALLVDTKTGEGLQLKSFSPTGKGVLCTELDGLRRPIEELLQELIERFLVMTLVPSGGEDVMSGEFRSMDYLKQKFLLQEYGWPKAFPLSPLDYNSLIRRQAELHKERLNHWRNQQTLDQKWNQLQRQWHEINGTDFRNPKVPQKVERFKVLDNRIEQALQYHIKRVADREYALAADVPLNTGFANPLTLSPSSHVGLDWRAEVTPAMIIERFNEVADPLTGADTDLEKMKVVLEKAYERWKLSEQGIYPREYVDEEDDDPTSDYAPSEDECSDEEEFGSDEEVAGLEFDVVMLEDDVTTDIEDLRRILERYQI